MKKAIYKALACISFIIFIIGIGAMDSESLGLPVILTTCGLFGSYIFARLSYEED